MAYSKVIVKEDDASQMKYFYVCQTPGCGEVINPDYPVGLKEPSPKRCADCMSAAVRKEIEAEHDARASRA